MALARPSPLIGAVLLVASGIRPASLLIGAVMLIASGIPRPGPAAAPQQASMCHSRRYAIPCKPIWMLGFDPTGSDLVTDWPKLAPLCGLWRGFWGRRKALCWPACRFPDRPALASLTSPHNLDLTM